MVDVDVDADETEDDEYADDTDDADEGTDYTDEAEDADEADEGTDSSRRLLRWKRFIPQPIRRIFARPAPAPRPAPVVRAAPVAPRAAPVAPRAAPVAPRAAPVAPKAAPVAPRAAPVAPRAAPVAPKAAPVAPRAAPVFRAAPVAPKVAPVIRKVAPVIRKVAPVIRKVAPVIRKVASVIRKAAPVIIKADPVIIKATPAVKKAATKVLFSKVKKAISKVKSVLPKINGVKIYGNFCGPNYCGGQKFKGAEGPKCQWGVAPKDSLDACCKFHDQCCGTPNTRGVRCNQEILSCLKNVKCSGVACNVAQSVMRATFSRLQNKVCGKVLGKASVSKPVVVKATPAPAPATVLPIYMTCDNEFDLYVNGNKIGRGTSWTTTYNFSPLVNLGDVIAIDGLDREGPAAFIGVFGGKVTKPADWRCSTKESAGWNKNNFDDSSWTKAVSYGRNQDNNIWRSVGGGSRPNIPADAEWLWTSDNNNHNRVYCRYFPVPAPKAVPVVVAPVVAPKAVVSAPKPAPVVSAPKPVPVVSAPKPVVSAPKPVVSAPKAAPKAVIDEIISAKNKANVKLTKFQEKLVKIMKETSDEQVKIETENRNNFNGVSVTLQNEQLRLDSARASMKTLYAETERLNATIQTHYKKLIADTSYLQSLDAMRPAFLKSLGELATHIAAVTSTVDTKIYKDEYKDEMMGFLTDIHSNTYNVSGYVAAAFINHYNKYKALIQKENVDYSSELKQLTVLSNNYKIQAQKSADIEKERVRLQDILSKLKATFTLSVSQRDDFDRLVKDVVAIFDKRCSVAPMLR